MMEFSAEVKHWRGLVLTEVPITPLTPDKDLSLSVCGGDQYCLLQLFHGVFRTVQVMCKGLKPLGI